MSSPVEGAADHEQQARSVPQQGRDLLVEARAKLDTRMASGGDPHHRLTPAPTSYTDLWLLQGTWSRYGLAHTVQRAEGLRQGIARPNHAAMRLALCDSPQKVSSGCADYHDRT